MYRNTVRFIGYLGLTTVLATLGLMPAGSAQDAIGGGDDKKDAPIAFKSARIHTAAGPIIARGVLVIQKGKIIAVGAEDAVKIPAGAVVRDLTGKTIIPGLVDTHSHIGIFSR